MRVLLLNQTFYPDVMATGQYLSDVARELVRQGHSVTVVTSRRAYDHPERVFPKRENWEGIEIRRVSSTGFGKASKWRRAVDFASFLAMCAGKLALLPRPDTVVALTSPPLISFFGATLARWRRARFVYWVMDFNPDEAIAAGWLQSQSPVARVLEAMSRFSLRRSHCIVALDRFMKERIQAKGVASERIVVLPPWSLDGEVKFDLAGRDRFRRAHGFDDRFVVMYSGNHSPCHPLETLLRAAEQLVSDPEILFCFIGGGSEWRKIKELIQREPERMRNVRCLPYQPLNELSASLSAADLQVVVMGDPFVGLVHPCKVYNLLKVGRPILYIGPAPSHVTELMAVGGPDWPDCCRARHGDVSHIVGYIREQKESAGKLAMPPGGLHKEFARDVILPDLVRAITGAVCDVG